jgi:hypothetical protein
MWWNTLRDRRPEERFQESLRDLCGLFVGIVDKKIYLFHQTAREFLLQYEILHPFDPNACDCPGWRVSSDEDGTSPSLRDNSGVGWHPFNFEACQEILAQNCIHYLMADLDEPNTDEPSFLGYAAQYWVAHFQLAGNGMQDFEISLAAELCNDVRNVRSYAVELNIQCYDFHKSKSLLVMPAVLELPRVLEFLVRDGNVDINALDRMKRTPLHYLVDLRVDAYPIFLLIEMGADLEIEDHRGCTVLQTAVMRSYPELVSMLLTRGAKMNARILDWAAIRGDTEILDLLNDFGACWSSVLST